VPPIIVDKKKSPKVLNKAQAQVATKNPEASSFKGPNLRKRHRKPDEIYGDVSIPDSARKE
jgi:hypothetical protein